MKDKFPGFFNKPDATNELLWKECIFVFDANILLNLYRYSDETRDLFISTIEQLKQRIWLPYRAAYEYLENRPKVIHEQQEHYATTIKEVTELSKKLENSRQHPFVSKETLAELNQSISKLTSELEHNKRTHETRITSDEIKEKVAEVFTGSTGEEITSEKLEEIIKVGEKRYSEKTPPGYSDAKKTSEENTLSARCRPYGDLIVWLEIIEKSKAEGKHIIFVTDDGKEDWWLRFKGKTLGARPELIKEFTKETGNLFHMYHPEHFLAHARNYLQEETSEDALQEIIDVRDKESVQPGETIEHRLPPEHQTETEHTELNYLKTELSHLTAKLEHIAIKLYALERTRETINAEFKEFLKLSLKGTPLPPSDLTKLISDREENESTIESLKSTKMETLLQRKALSSRINSILIALGEKERLL